MKLLTLFFCFSFFMISCGSSSMTENEKLCQISFNLNEDISDVYSNDYVFDAILEPSCLKNLKTKSGYFSATVNSQQKTSLSYIKEINLSSLETSRKVNFTNLSKNPLILNSEKIVYNFNNTNNDPILNSERFVWMFPWNDDVEPFITVHLIDSLDASYLPSKIELELVVITK